MAKEPKHFVFELSFEEASLIMGASGKGGHQNLHRHIVRELEAHENKVTLNDQQMGELIRYMTRYGSGGFQGRLSKAFRRSVVDLFNGI